MENTFGLTGSYRSGYLLEAQPLLGSDFRQPLKVLPWCFTLSLLPHPLSQILCFGFDLSSIISPHPTLKPPLSSP